MTDPNRSTRCRPYRWPPEYPECYLHVRHCPSGEEFVFPLRGNAKLDIVHQIKRWIVWEIWGEQVLDGRITPGVAGEYYARIMTDHRKPESAICWASAGFYLKSNYE